MVPRSDHSRIVVLPYSPVGLPVNVGVVPMEVGIGIGIARPLILAICIRIKLRAVAGFLDYGLRLGLARECSGE
jgi:hypothetical protein